MNRITGNYTFEVHSCKMCGAVLDIVFVQGDSRTSLAPNGVDVHQKWHDAMYESLKRALSGE